MEVIALYEFVDGEDLSKEEYDDQVVKVQHRYLEYKRKRLDQVFSDMRNSRLVTNTSLHKAGSYPPACTLEWWMLALYKFYRLLFICFYYYLMPFLIIVFQVLLLYVRLLQADVQSFNDLTEKTIHSGDGTPDIPEGPGDGTPEIPREDP